MKDTAMFRTIASALSVVVVTAGIWSSNVQADVKFEGGLCRIVIDLPNDRWTLNRSKESTRRGYIRATIGDSHSVANIRLEAEAKWRHQQYASIDEWFEGRILPRRLERYSSDYGYDILSTKKSDANLASGEAVKVVEYYLDINDNSRNVRFAYFPDREDTHWHSVFVFNSGVYRDQDRAFKEILKGISLRR